MLWLVITSPDFFDGEAQFLHRLFAHGVDIVHLRKPGATAEDCARLLDGRLHSLTACAAYTLTRAAALFLTVGRGTSAVRATLWRKSGGIKTLAVTCS